MVANGLHRKAHLRRASASLLGERVLRSFASQGALSNHDAEDASGLLAVGHDEDGRDVEVNRRVAESDLVVHVSLNPFASTVGTLPAGLASATTLRRRGGLTGGGDGGDATLHAAGLHDRRHAHLGHAVRLVGLPEQARVGVGVRDQIAVIGARRALDLAPKSLRHKVFAGLHAPYQVAAVVAGDPGAARGTALGSALQQQARRGAGPERRARAGRAVRRAVQRRVDHQPGARREPRARHVLPRAHRPPAGARGRRGDRLPPGDARLPPAPPEPTSTSTRRCSAARPTRR
ncbi:hypothetical protein GCM10025868_25870 [Angustibacter aerolatus]|uniref:LarA-like N-terminal domain-containing protein n=1 Tax=Angustibacter aerolatus TaxID=1162965 RepID=A0ABQ6JHW8_9ACTN|nr:lactate racemase domain-containing protein [Angustibacter aerolatus]GMA87337.1 hypothetical protein GCM10025868_25870 [Angustibacter aerolatus]